MGIEEIYNEDERVRKAREEAEDAGQSFNVYHRHNVNERGGDETKIVEFERDGKPAGGFVSSGSFITKGSEVFGP